MNILIIGTGYVGTTTGLVFGEMGHKVTGLDLDEKKLSSLKSGRLHFYEPGLDDLLKKHIQNKNITFTNESEKAIKENEIIFICVGTPQGKDGGADLRYVKGVAESIGKYMDQYKVIIDKSTVPVGTAELVTQWIKVNQSKDIPFDVVSNPEFLREGSALTDALNPDRIVIGCPNDRSKKIMKELYKDFQCPIVETEPKAAELIKYAANSFLALKISFINEVARLCDALNINIKDISTGIGHDKRIGKQFLKAGIGYGGSCFPKDVNALLDVARKYEHRLTILEAAVRINETQTDVFLHKIKKQLGELYGKRLAILGLAFKENTDDTRESPSYKIIESLLGNKALLNVHDPVVKITRENVTQYETVLEAVEDADAIILCTEWAEYQNLDWNQIKEIVKTPIVFDGRNYLDANDLKDKGFIYRGIGYR